MCLLFDFEESYPIQRLLVLIAVEERSRRRAWVIVRFGDEKVSGQLEIHQMLGTQGKARLTGRQMLGLDLDAASNTSSRYRALANDYSVPVYSVYRSQWRWSCMQSD